LSKSQVAKVGAFLLTHSVLSLILQCGLDEKTDGHTDRIPISISRVSNWRAMKIWRRSVWRVLHETVLVMWDSCWITDRQSGSAMFFHMLRTYILLMHRMQTYRRAVQRSEGKSAVCGDVGT